MFGRIGCALPRGISPYKPVSTWILEKLGRLPEEGDRFVFEDLTVKIEETEQNRVLFVTVKLADPEIDLPVGDEGEEVEK